MARGQAPAGWKRKITPIFSSDNPVRESDVWVENDGSWTIVEDPGGAAIPNYQSGVGMKDIEDPPWWKEFTDVVPDLKGVPYADAWEVHYDPNSPLAKLATQFNEAWLAAQPKSSAGGFVSDAVGLAGGFLESVPKEFLAAIAAGGLLSGLGGVAGAAEAGGGFSGELAGIGGAGTGVEALPALASDAGFVPGAFDIGASSYGGTAAAGLDAAAAGTIPGYSLGSAAQTGLSLADQQLLNSGLGDVLSGNVIGTTAPLTLTDVLKSPSSALSELTGIDSGTLNTVGDVVGAGLGYLGATATGDAQSDIANKYLDLGAPYRAQLEASYAPGFNLATADPAFQNLLDTQAQAKARALSVKGSVLDPGAQSEIDKYLFSNVAAPYLANYRGQLGQFGGLGLNTAGTADLASTNTAGAGYNALGFLTGALTQPSESDSLEGLLKKLGTNYGLKLNVGGLT